MKQASDELITNRPEARALSLAAQIRPPVCTVVRMLAGDKQK